LFALRTKKPRPTVKLDPEDQKTLLVQFVDAVDHAEDSYDESIRTLAAAGVAVTASLATARHGFSGGGLPAMVALLVSLALTVGSHQATRSDLMHRIACLNAETYDPAIYGVRTRVTAVMNALAGIALLVGGICLAFFASSSFK
jgi:hypothetical protein